MNFFLIHCGLPGFHQESMHQTVDTGRRDASSKKTIQAPLLQSQLGHHNQRAGMGFGLQPTELVGDHELGVLQGDRNIASKARPWLKDLNDGHTALINHADAETDAAKGVRQQPKSAGGIRRCLCCCGGRRGCVGALFLVRLASSAKLLFRKESGGAGRRWKEDGDVNV